MELKKDQKLFEQLSLYNTELRQKDEQIYFLKQDLQRLEKDAIIDPRTELYSTAFFYARLKEEVARSERYRHFFSVVIAHVEPSPADSTGNVTQAIRVIGREIGMTLTRQTDIIATLGRTQLVILLTETDRSGADALLSRIKSLNDPRDRPVYYGVLAFPEDASNVEMVLAQLEEISNRLERNTLREGRSAPVI